MISDNADLQVKNFHYTEVGDPDLVWEIDADTAKYVKEKNLALFENIRLKIAYLKGKTFLMTGKGGTLDTETKEINVYGDVTIISDNGDRFETDSLKFFNYDRRIYTEEKITMVNPNIRVEGKGMSLSLIDRKLSILSDVDVTIDNVNMGK